MGHPDGGSSNTWTLVKPFSSSPLFRSAELARSDAGNGTSTVAL
jgi:hypothetical protein